MPGIIGPILPGPSNRSIASIASMMYRQLQNDFLEQLPSPPFKRTGVLGKFQSGRLKVEAGQIVGKMSLANGTELSESYGVVNRVATPELLAQLRILDIEAQEYSEELLSVEYKSGKGSLIKSDNVPSTESNLKVLAKLVGKPIKLNFIERQSLIIRYNEGLKTAYEGAAKGIVDAMRDELQEAALQGKRSEEVLNIVRKYRGGISEARLKLTARQETVATVSAIREQKARRAGIVAYEWRTSGDARVRHSHDALNQKIWRFDSPPYIDEKRTRRGNPGDDFNCRCIARPVLGDIEQAGTLDGVPFYRISGKKENITDNYY